MGRDKRLAALRARYGASVLPPTRVAEIEAIVDDDIDTSDIPEAGEEFFQNAKRRRPPAKDEQEDPEVVWRRVIRARLELATMLFGSWKRVHARQLIDLPRLHEEPESYGPPIPR